MPAGGEAPGLVKLTPPSDARIECSVTLWSKCWAYFTLWTRICIIPDRLDCSWTWSTLYPWSCSADWSPNTRGLRASLLDRTEQLQSPCLITKLWKKGRKGHVHGNMCCEEYGWLIYERRFNPTHFYLIVEDDTLREVRLSSETK